MKKYNSVKFIDSLHSYLDKKRAERNLKNVIKLYILKYFPILLLFLTQNILFILIFGALWWVFVTMFFDHRDITQFNPIIRIWFGVPGSGKTTMAAWLSRQSMLDNYRVLSNVSIKGAYKLNDNDLGTYDMSFGGQGCHVIIDEAMVKGLYNREFKAFAKSNKPLYFSEHRHMNNMVDVFSQGYDIDLNVKQRAGNRGLFHISKSFPNFVCYRRIKKIFFIKKDDKQFIDGYSYIGLPRFVYAPSVWGMFDTNDLSDCPTMLKEWELWPFDDDEPLGV